MSCASERQHRGPEAPLTFAFDMAFGCPCRALFGCPRPGLRVSRAGFVTSRPPISPIGRSTSARPAAAPRADSEPHFGNFAVLTGLIERSSSSGIDSPYDSGQSADRHRPSAQIPHRGQHIQTRPPVRQRGCPADGHARWKQRCRRDRPPRSVRLFVVELIAHADHQRRPRTEGCGSLRNRTFRMNTVGNDLMAPPPGNSRSVRCS